MCVICRGTYHGILYLNCSGCQKVKNIPVINGLRILKCTDCPLITNIPWIPGLQKLDCSRCPRITHIPRICTLTTIQCNDCPQIEQITLSGLNKTLWCIRCRALTDITVQCSEINEIVCVDCPVLKHFKSDIKQIQINYHLDARNCRSLTDISIFNVEYMAIGGCQWLRPTVQQIDQLIKLQQWVRKIRLSKQIQSIIGKIIPIYYHPEMKGGYMHKRDMGQFIKGVEESRICSKN